MKLFKKKNRDNVELEMDRLLTELSKYSPEDERYAKINAQLVQLNGLKEPKRKLSSDTVALIVGNVLVTVMILGFEQFAAVTSKAYSYTMKGRG